MYDCFLHVRDVSNCTHKRGSKHCFDKCEECGTILNECSWYMSEKEIKEKIKEMENDRCI